MTIITRTNGQPFATEASTWRQQLTAKGLQGTHEVVPYDGGYALVAKQSEGESVTLMAGDHVSTEGMTEEQYHAVARAFMEAGAEKSAHAPRWTTYPLLGWDARDGTLYAHREHLYKCWTGRHLTIAQVLGATNAGNATPQPEESTMNTNPITTLKQARTTRNEAEQAYQEALEEAREYLGDGFELTEVGTDGPLVDGEDMTDPANWREGDVVTCISTDRDHQKDFERGLTYTLADRVDEDGWVRCWVGKHSRNNLPADHFRFHHRPN